MKAESFDAIIVGGGAAGLMCAIEAGKRGRSTLVLERSESVGKKIRISGGGRCNFTNIIVNDECFLSDNPRFCRSALARYTPDDFIALIEKHRIRYHEKTLGQLFCDGSSREIIAMLLEECKQARVNIVTDCHVNDISRDSRFSVSTDRGLFESETLVIATGGLSVPKSGATDLGYRVAKKFEVPLVPVRPGLVPLRFGVADRSLYSALSGISFEAVVSFGSAVFRENVLITHRGLSGPAILQISSYWKPGEPVLVDLLPDTDVVSLAIERLTEPVQLVSMLSDVLPKRLAKVLCESFGGKPFNRNSRADLEAIDRKLHRWEVWPDGTEGFEKAEVTVGGVDTNVLSSKTMEARFRPGLFFIGEVVDVTGHLGGYNFQWAWSSGHAAGQVV